MGSRVSSRRGLLLAVAVAVLVSVAAGLLAAAGDDPVFVRFLIPGDPFDETLRDYWERSGRDELDGVQLVDLGTMLFERGFPKDAIRMYRRALETDRDLHEAWFRIGLAYHSMGEPTKASQAYRRCLKRSPGHGWANFYLGRIEEELGHTRNAMDYLRKAFRHAPELADPKVNPEVLDSKLALGAELVAYDQRQMERNLPARYLRPKQVAHVRRQYEREAPTPPGPAEVEIEAGDEVADEARDVAPGRAAPPTIDRGPSPTPLPQRPPRSIPVRRAPTPPPVEHRGDSDVTPYGVPEIGSVSGEGRVVP